LVREPEMYYIMRKKNKGKIKRVLSIS